MHDMCDYLRQGTVKMYDLNNLFIYIYSIFDCWLQKGELNFLTYA